MRAPEKKKISNPGLLVLGATALMTLPSARVEG